MNVYVWYNEGAGRPWDKVVHIKATQIYSCAALDFALLEVEEDFDYMHVGLAPPENSECAIICPHRKDSPYWGIAKYNTVIGDKFERESGAIVGPKLSPGTSGSPVVHEDKVVGLHWGGGTAKYSPDVALYIPFKCIAAKLKKKFGYLL